MTDAPFDVIDPIELHLEASLRAWADQAVEPVDALEIARAAAASGRRGARLRTPGLHIPHGRAASDGRSAGRSPSILAFALLTLLAAVALMGTSLVFVAGQRTTPPPETTDPLDRLRIKEIAPGVERVLADDAGHDLTTTRVYQVDFGPDGAVRMLSAAGLLRLGEPDTFRDDGGAFDPCTDSYGPHPGELLAAADGTVWATRPCHPWAVTSFDGRGWTNRYEPGRLRHPAVRIARLPDGNVLAAWGGATDAPPVIGRFDGQTWTFEDDTGWPATLAGELGQYSSGLAVADDGAVWVSTGVEISPPRGGDLLRYKNGSWDVVDAPFAPESFAAGPGGTLWIASHDRLDGSSPPPLRLARYDGTVWETWTAPDGFEPGIMYWDENFLPMVVGPDGSAWLRLGRDGGAPWSGQRCDGLGRFDGATWSTYLPGTCVLDIEPAPDGSVWVATYLPETAVYRIHP